MIRYSHLTGTLLLVLPLVAGSATPSAPPLQVAPSGIASEGCANNDGPAVDFVFKVLDNLPAAPEFTGPPVGNQELHVRVNATLPQVKDLRRWKVGNPDGSGGLLAWVCPIGGYPCDSAVSGTVKFTSATAKAIDGEWSLILQSGRRVEGSFSTSLAARNSRLRCG